MRNATGKGNDIRKVLTHYRINHGVHPPYRVLCDGPIIHLAPARDIELKTSIPKLLGAPATFFVTRCILDELRALGDDFSAAAAFAKRCPRVPCAHGSSRKSSAECMAALIEKGNESGCILATNDPGVVTKAMEKGEFPVMTIANQTRLVMRKPSLNVVQSAQQKNEESNSALSSSDKAFLAKNLPQPKRRLPVATRIRKRKRPKGPNPLSVKKSTKASLESAVTKSTGAAITDEATASGSVKRARRRRRKAKGGTQAEATGNED